VVQWGCTLLYKYGKRASTLRPREMDGLPGGPFGLRRLY